jgi:hypothetical protein
MAALLPLLLESNRWCRLIWHILNAVLPPFVTVTITSLLACFVFALAGMQAFAGLPVGYGAAQLAECPQPFSSLFCCAMLLFQVRPRTP